MRCSFGLVAALALLLRQAPLQAQEAHEIKIKEPGKGAYVGQVHKTENHQFKVADNDGKILEQKNDHKAESYVYRETILERPEGQRPTQLKRQYDKAAAGADDDMKSLPYEGKTVAIAEKDGTYSFRVEGGGELGGDEAVHLDKEFNKNKDDKAGLDKLLMPGKAVKVGETWKVPVELFVKFLGQKGDVEFDGDKATGSGKLLRVYKQGGKQFGVFDFHLDMPIKKMKLGEQQPKLEAGSKVTLSIGMDACIDGGTANYASTFVFHLHAVALLPDPDQATHRVTLDLRGTNQSSLKELTE